VYEASAIRGQRYVSNEEADGKKEGRWEYLCGWMGLPRSRDSWESWESLKETDLIKAGDWTPHTTIPTPALIAQLAEQGNDSTHLCYGQPKEEAEEDDEMCAKAEGGDNEEDKLLSPALLTPSSSRPKSRCTPSTSSNA
jgi:hypothetical protein